MTISGVSKEVYSCATPSGDFISIRGVALAAFHVINTRIMNQRAAFLLQILERLGAPLVAAVSAVSARADTGGNGGNPAKDAERVAELLARSVQASVALTESSGLRNGGDSVRLALAAIAAQLLGDNYRQTGKIIVED